MKRTTNKKSLLLVLAAGLLVLTGCDDIRSRATDYEDKILDSTSEIANNIMSIVYDAMDDGGTTNTMVLNKTLEVFAESVFGPWTKALEAYVAGKESDVFKDFVKAHSFYAIDEEAELSASEALDLQFNRLKNFVESIQKRIKEKLFTEIKSSSFAKDNCYYESKFANSLRQKLFTVTDGMGYPTIWYDSTEIDSIIITPSFDEEDVAAFLHLEYYDDYINRQIIPEIYRARLSEQWIYNQNYSTLGRSYARKVNVVSLKEKGNGSAVSYLMQEFVEKHIVGSKDADLEILANAYRGIDLLEGGDEVALLKSAKCAPIFVEDQIPIPGGNLKFYKNTDYGDLLDSYKKINDNQYITDKTAESDFTGGYTYPKEHGLELKTHQAMLNDYTVDGWFIKNGGLSDLPETIRTRLFNIGVANNVIESELEGSHEFDVNNRYVKKFKNYYYLIPSSSLREDDFSIIWSDTTKSSQYIIQIEAAVKAAKLSLNSTNGYEKTFKEKTAYDIAKIYGDNETYRTSALAYYVKAMNLKFYDQKVYDYFVTSFPDVFKD